MNDKRRKRGRSYLSDGNNLPVRAPAGILKELGYLRSFARAGLTNDDCDRVFLDEIEQAVMMLGDREQSCGFMECRNKICTELKIRHSECAKSMRIRNS